MRGEVGNDVKVPAVVIRAMAFWPDGVFEDRNHNAPSGPVTMPKPGNTV